LTELKKDKNLDIVNARDSFINKDYKSSIEKHENLLNDFGDELNDSFKSSRNSYNNLIISYAKLLIQKDINDRDEDIKKIFYYLDKYFSLAKKENKDELKMRWDGVVLYELFETIIEVILIKYSPDNEESLIKEGVNKYIKIFLEIFQQAIGDEKFFKSFLNKIYSERINSKREAGKNQYINNTKILATLLIEILISLKSDDKFINETIANMYILLADLEYYYQTQKSKNHTNEKKSIELYEKSLKYSETVFAKERISQLKDIIISSDSLALFRHDMVSKMSTYKTSLEKLLKPDYKEDEKKVIIYENIHKINYLLNLFSLIQNDIPNNKTYSSNDVEENFDPQIKKDLKINFEKTDVKFKSDIKYLNIIIENLLKNSLDAYKRNNISDRLVFINFDVKKNLLEFRDFAGGVKAELLINKRLLDSYVSEKNVAQGHGLGLSLVTQAVELLGGELDIENYIEGDKKGVKFLIKNIFKKRERI
jgi:signal transduction histidine kinase